MELVDVATGQSTARSDERINESVTVFLQFSQGSSNAVRLTKWRSEILSRLTKSQNTGEKKSKVKKKNPKKEHNRIHW
jgi:hypothetical protein